MRCRASLIATIASSCLRHQAKTACEDQEDRRGELNLVFTFYWPSRVFGNDTGVEEEKNLVFDSCIDYQSKELKRFSNWKLIFGFASPILASLICNSRSGLLNNDDL
jgi:hypothetical protein